MRRVLALAALAMVGSLAACSSGASEAFPEGALAVVASSDVAVGSDRLLVGVSLPDATRLGSPDDGVSIEIAPLDGPEDVRTFPADFIWIVPDAVGIYRAQIETDRPGAWSVTVVPDDGAVVAPSALQVKAESLTPAVGSTAIAVATPTLEDSGIEELSTDPDPDPAFYEISLDEAFASGRPTVVVFATPAFCQTAACGPMLDNVKHIADGYPDVNFVHVEVYQGFTEPGFAPDGAHLAPAVQAWGLPSEPWVFVVDGEGTIVAKFEGVVAEGELVEALRQSLEP
jgi:hypothetical protein